VERRDDVVRLLRPLLAGVRRVNDPVVKLRLPAAFDPDALAGVDFGISANLYDPSAMRFVNDHAPAIAGIGEALGCGAAVARWLEAIRPFDCFLSYCCVGPDFVTFYYKSTRLERRRPAPHLAR
jgi:hypothetical protein